MALFNPPLNTTQVVGPFNTLADYDVTMAWFNEASPAALVIRTITSYVGDPETLTITVVYPARTADIDTANPI